MEPQVRTLVEIEGTQAALTGRADMVLERARWAAEVFQRYDFESTMTCLLYTSPSPRD